MNVVKFQVLFTTLVSGVLLMSSRIRCISLPFLGLGDC